jgi:hypothetical protein
MRDVSPLGVKMSNKEFASPFTPYSTPLCIIYCFVRPILLEISTSKLILVRGNFLQKQRTEISIRIQHFFLPWRNSPSEPKPPHYREFTITLRPTTLGRTPLDEWSARRRDLYLTTHDNHTRQISIPPAGFEPTIPASNQDLNYICGHIYQQLDFNITTVVSYFIILTL